MIKLCADSYRRDMSSSNSLRNKKLSLQLKAQTERSSWIKHWALTLPLSDQKTRETKADVTMGEKTPSEVVDGRGAEAEVEAQVWSKTKPGRSISG